jgi:hypothetical protein
MLLGFFFWSILKKARQGIIGVVIEIFRSRRLGLSVQDSWPLSPFRKKAGRDFLFLLKR